MIHHWLRRLRGALGMGVTWALGWGLAGIGIGIASVVTPFFPWAPFFRVFDAPLPAMAVPGFFYGVFFSIVLGIAGRNRRFADLSMARFAMWGAVGGVIFPALLVATGAASPSSGESFALGRVALMTGTLCLFSTLSAMATLALARKAERGALTTDGDATAAISAGSVRFRSSAQDAERERRR